MHAASRPVTSKGIWKTSMARRSRPPAAPCVRGPWGLQVPHGRVAGHAQHVALAALAELVAKPRVTTKLIIACHPAMWHLIPPCVEHLQTLFVARVIPHRLWHVAFLASLLVSCPLRRERQA